MVVVINPCLLYSVENNTVDCYVRPSPFACFNERRIELFTLLLQSQNRFARPLPQSCDLETFPLQSEQPTNARRRGGVATGCKNSKCPFALVLIHIRVAFRAACVSNLHERMNNCLYQKGHGLGWIQSRGLQGFDIIRRHLSADPIPWKGGLSASAHRADRTRATVFLLAVSGRRKI